MGVVAARTPRCGRRAAVQDHLRVYDQSTACDMGSYVHPRGAIGIVKFRREAINSSYQKNGHFVFCHVCVRDHVHDALQMDCA